MNYALYFNLVICTMQEKISSATVIKAQMFLPTNITRHCYNSRKLVTWGWMFDHV